jgi:hypothetical protein
MTTTVRLNKKRFFEAKGNLPLNIGDVFSYIGDETDYLSSKIDNITERINQDPYSSDDSKSYSLKHLSNSIERIKEHHEKYVNATDRITKFIVVDKSVTFNHQMDLTNRGFIEDHIGCHCSIDIELYDQSYIRNKKMEQLLQGETVCNHEFVAREYSSQPYGTCLTCGQTVFSN